MLLRVSGISPDFQCVKLTLGDGSIKEFFPKDYPTTLNKLEFYHCAQVTITLKEEEYPELEAAPLDNAASGMVTILVSFEESPEGITQHLIPLKWRVKDLITELKALYSLEPDQPIRIRKLIDNTVFSTEEKDLKLNTLSEFSEGGFRFSVEKGFAPSQGEIVLKVSLSEDEESKEIFVLPTSRIAEVKDKVGILYGIDMEDYKLYRTD